MANVIVTGCAGFIGSQLTSVLLKKNFRVFGIDNLSTGNIGNIKHFKNHKKFFFFKLDLLNPKSLNKIFNKKILTVFHLAANADVRFGTNHPDKDLKQNTIVTFNVLNQMRKHNVKNIVFSSTGSIYGEAKEFPTKEFSQFPTQTSLYGASKLASETLILEYGECFDFPVWINRCGVLAGAGQFGKADQGIFSYWIHSFREKNPLKYIGFNGTGHQVRDAMHPKDLVPLLYRQIMDPEWEAPKILNIGGGRENSMSLKELSIWCEDRFGQNEVISSKADRPMDAPWIIMDSTTAQNAWNWKIKTELQEILNEIADYAEKNPSWLSLTT